MGWQNKTDAEARSPKQIASEITKELKIAWKALPADERTIYEEISIAEKARYTEQVLDK